MQAVNEPTFWPEVTSDPAFMAWATRVGLRMVNKPPGSLDSSIERAILMEGTPNPEWAHGLAFMMNLAQSNKREAVA